MPQAAHPAIPARVPQSRGSTPGGASVAGDAGSLAERAARPARSALVPGLIGFAAGAPAFLLVRRSLIDDAYITLCYARNLAFHGQWALVTGHPANTASSPLNVLLLAAAAFVTRHVVLGLGLVFAGSCAALAVALDGLFARAGLRRSGAVTAALLLIADPLLLSTVGMEVMLVLVLTVATLRTALSGRVAATGLLCAAMLLTRIDAVVISAVCVLGVPATRGRRLRIAGIAALAAAPWFLLSWTALGALLPDSVMIKLMDRGWQGLTFGRGLFVYFHRMPAAIAVSVVCALAGACWLLPAVRRAAPGAPWRRPVAVLGLGALAHFALLAATGPAPFHWYYGPSVGLATIVFAALCSRPAAAGAQAAHRVALAAALAVATAFDLGTGMPWRLAPVSTNWATSAEYTRIGRALAPLVHGRAVHSPGEIGELAFFCGCDIVDVFSSRAEFQRELAAWEAKGGSLRRGLVALDYLFAARPQPPSEISYSLIAVVEPERGASHWPIGTRWTDFTMPGVHTLELTRTAAR
jgi:hypothetical protein